MAIVGAYEQTHTRRYALSVVDKLAQLLGSKGPFPPPIGEVACEILSQSAPVAATFDPPLVVYAIRNASGFVLLDGTYTRIGSRGKTLPLADGTYHVRVSGAYYQDLEFDVDWPPAGDSVRVPADHDLLPGPAYPFPAITPSTLPPPDGRARPYSRGFTLIRGSVFAPDGDPIRGAKAELFNFVFNPAPPVPNPPPPAWTVLSCVTNTNGDWAILLPDRLRFKNVVALTNAEVTHNVTIRITFPDTSTLDLPRTVPLGTEYSLKQTALRGRVTRKGGRPIADAAISTSAGPASTSRAGGEWSLYFPLDQTAIPTVTVTATTPDGASQSVATPVVAEKTLVVPTFEFA